MYTSAENMRRVSAAKDHHDRTCRYGGKASEGHLTPHDIVPSDRSASLTGHANLV
jgi:hypothetical protein